MFFSFFYVKSVFQLEMSYIFISDAYSFKLQEKEIYCKYERWMLNTSKSQTDGEAEGV